MKMINLLLACMIAIIFVMFFYEIIKNMKINNTPKKIQIHIKEKFKISITQQAIRDI